MDPTLTSGGTSLLMQLGLCWQTARKWGLTVSIKNTKVMVVNGRDDSDVAPAQVEDDGD